MEIIDKILINQFAQDIVSEEPILNRFNLLDIDKKRYFLNILIGYFIMQSKPTDDDIEQAIRNSKLKPTYTPCVLLRKGVATHNLLKISQLPENELNKTLILFLSLFRIAYLRRYTIEKDHPHKWWYWDLSDPEKIKYILDNY